MFIKSIRPILVRLHLCLALVFGGVFVLLGLTGSILSWMPELDQFFNPALLRGQLNGGDPESITPLMIHKAFDSLMADPHYGRPKQLTLPANTEGVIVAWYLPTVPTSGASLHQNWSRQVMLDPTTLLIKGERNWGQYGFSPQLLMPTIYHLHRYMLLGEIGKIVIAVSGLMLVLMAISGLFLWLPKSTWKAWRQALTVNLAASAAAVNFRLHRMIGFFALPVLLMLGFSGAYFNQTQWLLPVVSKVLSVTEPRQLMIGNAQERQDIGITKAMQLVQDIFPNARISRVGLPSESFAAYEIRLRQPAERHRADGATKVTIDAKSGRVLRSIDPLQGQSGDTFLAWLFPLHSGIAFGIWGRIFISIFGLLPLIMMITGWRIWRKRSA